MDLIEETEGLRKISAGELRRLCRQARDQQRAAVLEKAVERYPDSMLVTLPVADLRVLSQGGRVMVQEVKPGHKKRVFSGPAAEETKKNVPGK